MTLSDRLKRDIKRWGADLVGFADLRAFPDVQRNGYNHGVSIAVAINPAIINGIGNAHTKEYYDEYHRINGLLDDLDNKTAEYIKDSGYQAWPLTRANIKLDYKNHSTLLPHKTVATRAGLGWIGKCALLVTPQYGSAIRISTVLTDAPLNADRSVEESHCGKCDNCVRNCPGEALSGSLWSAGMDRNEFFDYMACRNTAVKRTWRISPGETHCGLCILVCPHTRKYIVASGQEYDFPSVDIAERGDLEEILKLQKLAYQSEAILYNDFDIPPLTQTLASLLEEAKKTIILKVVEDRKIIGSIRAYEDSGNCYIGKLMVHPDYQNRGVGKKLVKSIEKCFDGVRFELFTGHLSEKNLSLYEKLGYKRFKSQKAADNLLFIYLEKRPPSLD